MLNGVGAEVNWLNVENSQEEVYGPGAPVRVGGPHCVWTPEYASEGDVRAGCYKKLLRRI